MNNPKDDTNTRIKQTSPRRREDLIRKDDNGIHETHYKGTLYGISFALWKMCDVRFPKNPRTYSLAGLRNTYTGEVIYDKVNEVRGIYISYNKLHRLEDASHIYNLCFREYIKYKEGTRLDPLEYVQDRVRDEIEQRVRRNHHRRWLKRFRETRDEEMQRLYGKPKSLISKRERDDFHHGIQRQ